MLVETTTAVAGNVNGAGGGSMTEAMKIAVPAVVTFLGGGWLGTFLKDGIKYFGSPMYLYKRAERLYPKKRKRKKAMALYDKAFEREPTLIEALEKIASNQITEGQFQRVVDTYTRCINSRQDKILAVYDTMRLIWLYEQNVEKEPNNPKWLIRLRECHLFLQEHKQDVDNYKRLGSYYSGRAICLFLLVQYNEAIEDFSKVISLDPQNALAHRSRGLAKAGLGKYEEAIEDYDKAIKLDPKDVLVYNERGYAKANLGKHKAAIEDYDKAIELNPKDVLAYYHRTIAYNALGQTEKAAADYAKAEELEQQQNQ